MNLKHIKAVAAFCFVFAAATASVAYADTDMSFGENIRSEEGHRFVELRGAIPAFPALTSHGAVQSFVVGVSDFFGSVFAGGKDYDSATPKLATDMNITFFLPFGDYRMGLMAGAAIDTWNCSFKKDGALTDETLSMNYYYGALHLDYGHWVFSSIGTRLSIYGEFSFGVLHYNDGDDIETTPCFGLCPFGIQFCPEKHIGFYFEWPHLGARPFLQVGVSIGL